MLYVLKGSAGLFIIHSVINLNEKKQSCRQALQLMNGMHKISAASLRYYCHLTFWNLFCINFWYC